MSPERWRRVEQLFEEAATIPPGQQTKWLADACAGDAELLEEVRQMLAADARGGVVQQPLEAAASEFLAPVRRAGPYRLRQELGHGGYGRRLSRRA